MRHFASAALMTPVKSHASFAASFPYSGAELPAARYGIMEGPTPAPLLPEDKAAKAKACCFGQAGRQKGRKENKELILPIIAEDLSLRKDKKESQKEIFP